MAEPVVPKRRRLGFSEIPRKVRWIIYANAAGGVGFGYLMIFITAYYPQIGIGSGTIGLILGSEGASMVVCAVPLGIYSDAADGSPRSWSPPRSFLPPSSCSPSLRNSVGSSLPQSWPASRKAASSQLGTRSLQTK